MRLRLILILILDIDIFIGLFVKLKSTLNKQLVKNVQIIAGEVVTFVR